MTSLQVLCASVVFDKAPVDDNFVTLIVQNQVKSNMELSLRGLMVLYSIRKLKQSSMDDIIHDCQVISCYL